MLSLMECLIVSPNAQKRLQLECTKGVTTALCAPPWVATLLGYSSLNCGVRQTPGLGRSSLGVIFWNSTRWHHGASTYELDILKPYGIQAHRIKVELVETSRGDGREVGLDGAERLGVQLVHRRIRHVILHRGRV